MQAGLVKRRSPKAHTALVTRDANSQNAACGRCTSKGTLWRENRRSSLGAFQQPRPRASSCIFVHNVFASGSVLIVIAIASLCFERPAVSRNDALRHQYCWCGMAASRWSKKWKHESWSMYLLLTERRMTDGTSQAYLGWVYANGAACAVLMSQACTCDDGAIHVCLKCETEV